ncbi:PilZ domain-containing protein, partial [Candidatus Omnitrophota bacterium]
LEAELEDAKVKLSAAEKESKSVSVRYEELLRAGRHAVAHSPKAKDGAVGKDQDDSAFKGRQKVQQTAQQNDKEIGNILLSKKIISRNILGRAMEYQSEYGGTITQYLLAFGYIDEGKLAQCLCEHFKLPYLPLSACDISKEVIRVVPQDIAEKHLLIPVDKIGNTITVVMQNPLDTKAINALKDATGCDVRPFVGVVSEIIMALEYYYHVKPKGKKKLPFFVESKAYVGLERRNSVRLKAELEISFPVQGHDKKTKTKDVSRDGFFFELDIPLPIGSILPIEVRLPQQFSPAPVTALTKVVKVLRLEEKIFEIHVMTTEISKKGLAAIIECASADSSKEKG